MINPPKYPKIKRLDDPNEFRQIRASSQGIFKQGDAIRSKLSGTNQIIKNEVVNYVTKRNPQQREKFGKIFDKYIILSNQQKNNLQLLNSLNNKPDIFSNLYTKIRLEKEKNYNDQMRKQKHLNEQFQQRPYYKSEFDLILRETERKNKKYLDQLNYKYQIQYNQNFQEMKDQSFNQSVNTSITTHDLDKKSNKINQIFDNYYEKYPEQTNQNQDIIRQQNIMKKVEKHLDEVYFRNN